MKTRGKKKKKIIKINPTLWLLGKKKPKFAGTNQDERDLELGKKSDVRMEKRDSFGDFNDVVCRRDAADQDAVNGGGLVLQRVKNEFYVGILRDLVLEIASHDLTHRDSADYRRQISSSGQQSGEAPVRWGS